MKENIKAAPKKELQFWSAETQRKKYYSEPTLSKLGLMQKVTMGGSYVTEDSGQGVGTGTEF